MAYVAGPGTITFGDPPTTCHAYSFTIHFRCGEPPSPPPWRRKPSPEPPESIWSRLWSPARRLGPASQPTGGWPPVVRRKRPARGP